MPERRKAETIDEPLAAELFDLAYRVSYRIVGSRPDAEDIAQESVARACVRVGRRLATIPTLGYRK